MIAMGAARSVSRGPARVANSRKWAGRFNPITLFMRGEQGVIYDPNDLSTLFQDAAGTTPVTAAGQPVGLMLDKRMGLALGPELVNDGGFDAGVFALPFVARGTVSHSSGAAALQTTTVAGAFGVATALADPVAATTGFYRIRIEVLSVSVASPTHRLRASPSTAQNSGVNVSQQLLMPTPGIYEATFFMAAGDTLTILAESGTATVGDTWLLGSVSVRSLPGNHVFQPTAASRPMLRQNATTGAYYLETDGSDDWMQTNAIDFTGTDKVSVFAGVRKLSDAATGVVCELSTNDDANNGSFRLSAPGAGGADKFSMTSKGTLLTAAFTNSAAFNAPFSAVIAAAGDISGDAVSLSLNGTDVAFSGGDPGTGNYGNYPLYLFRRAGTSLPFNGHFYGLTIVGRLTTDAETRNVERMLATKTGVTLA